MINSFVKFSALSKGIQSLFLFFLLAVFAISLVGCDSNPPKLMPAVKQFKTDKEKEEHLSHIRRDHKDLLLHKRDETMIKGIRTAENSLQACINCHVPEQHNGEILRHTNPEHFCSTCHGYVAAQLDCFQCHVDHPTSNTNATAKIPDDNIHNVLAKNGDMPTSKDLKNNVKKAVTGESNSE